MRSAILSGSMRIPLERLSSPETTLRRLTVKRQTMGDDAPQIIEAYSYAENNYLEVPRQFGLALCNKLGIEVIDQTSQGCAVHFPRVPMLRDYQVEPIAEVTAAKDNYYDYLFRARTGFGKTIGMLYVAAKHGRSTLILVDQENLKDQWIDALVTHFGFSREDIGTIQGDKCDYQGKAVTIAMVQTLSRGTRDYRDALAYFGFLIVDEVHTIGAPTFSMILFDIPATLRVGISATPERKDGTQPLLTGHLGDVRVAADAEHDVSRVYIVRSYGTYSWYANVSSKVGRFITEIADDGARNLLTMEIMHWLYQTGRDVLILSDRIEQLRHLFDMAYYMGVSEADMGLYTGRDPHYQYVKDPLPETDVPGQPEPISRLQMISKVVPKRQLAQILESARMIFATYGMFQKGVDVPRLSGGGDATPRSSAEQVHGRILRGAAAKEPIWLTVVDWNSYRSIHSSIQRLTDYAKSNAEIYEWLDEGGSRPCPLAPYVAEARKRIQQLKSMEIQSHKDGRQSLVSLSADEKLLRLQQGAAQHARAKQRKHSENAPISASDRRTRTTTTIGKTGVGPHATPIVVTTHSSRVPSHMAGSRVPARRGK